MFSRTIEIVISSLRMALQELWKNKLRTFLSLFGVTIGIFCIISVLAVVNSLQQNIQNELKSLGNNTIYVDKWVYQGGPDYPWWKYVNRPVPKYAEIKMIKDRTPSVKYATFCLQAVDRVSFGDNYLNGLNVYSVTEDFIGVQPLEFSYGRYISDAEFNYGTGVALIGNEVAAKIFGEAAMALNKEIQIRGKKIIVSGIIKKRGKQMIGGWDFDNSIILPYGFGRTIYNELKTDPVIMVQGRTDVSTTVFKSDLEVTMRSIHQLNPKEESDFALNDINDLMEEVGAMFASLNIGGAVIGGISLIVGLFGVANIMFVTVKERTPQIGLKKAIGAKSGVILTEFLLESAFLCIIGGLIGLILVYSLSKVLSTVLDFPVFLSAGNMVYTFVICLIVGVLAGIIPALQAAKMDPVKAIRSK